MELRIVQKVNFDCGLGPTNGREPIGEEHWGKTSAR